MRQLLQRGFTTMEVMIVVMVTGVLALAIMTLFSEMTKSSTKLRTQMDLDRDLGLFLYAVEQYVGQTVQVVRCQCVSGLSGCRNDADLSTEAASGEVFEFVYENAGDPKTFPAGGCLFSGSPGSAVAGTTIVPMGCKRGMVLRYTRPTLSNAAGGSKPGKLELVWKLPVAAAGASGTVIASIDNVTKFACGMTSNSVTSLSNSDLQMRIEVKARMNETKDTTSPYYETWSPDPADPKASTFNRGLRRAFMTQVFFRNLTNPGIQFGKVRQIKNCVVAGAAASAAAQCCSNYRNPTAGTCVDATACVAMGVAAPGGVADQCCSQMVSGGNCL